MSDLFLAPLFPALANLPNQRWFWGLRLAPNRLALGLFPWVCPPLAGVRASSEEDCPSSSTWKETSSSRASSTTWRTLAGPCQESQTSFTQTRIGMVTKAHFPFTFTINSIGVTANRFPSSLNLQMALSLSKKGSNAQESLDWSKGNILF